MSLYFSGLVVVVITSFYTNYLSTRLAENEKNNAALFGKAIVNVVSSDRTDLILEQEVINLNANVTRIQIILEDEMGNLDGFNFGDKRDKDIIFLEKEKEKLLKRGFEPIVGEGYASLIYYKNSFLLTLIKWFPMVQVLLIMIFIGLGYVSLNSSRKAEQNRVWVGLAKETAHQLGTPISAILGWIEMLKTMLSGKGEEMEIVEDLRSDVGKLELIADRFSKIGSAPKLERTEINTVLKESVEYMKKRSSKSVKFILNEDMNKPVYGLINEHLFSWVIENLLRNALDALGGKGVIEIQTSLEKQYLVIDLSDSGKGITSGKVKKVFHPGYTTKKRGWGLGLSLAKRIIEQYHKGKIFVKKSELNEGTTFRILLPAD